MAHLKEQFLMTSMLSKTFTFNIELNIPPSEQSAFKSLVTSTKITAKNLTSYTRLQEHAKQNMLEAILKLAGGSLSADEIKESDFEFIIKQKNGTKKIKSAKDLNKILMSKPDCLDMILELRDPNEENKSDV